MQTQRMLIVMDVDSTVIEQEVIELIASHAGVEDEVRRITESAMRGELDFEASLRARVALLAGLNADVLEQVRADVRLTTGAQELVRTLRETGHVIGLVSGGFDAVVSTIADDLGVDEFRANTLEIVDGRLTGRVLGGVVDRAAKAQYLREFAATYGVPMNRTIAIGDGANDLDMMRDAELGIAFCAKPVVQQQADVALNTRDLRLVLDILSEAF
mgnify:CR=1 FL=1